MRKLEKGDEKMSHISLDNKKDLKETWKKHLIINFEAFIFGDVGIFKYKKV